MYIHIMNIYIYIYIVLCVYLYVYLIVCKYIYIYSPLFIYLFIYLHVENIWPKTQVLRDTPEQRSIVAYY